MKRKLVIALALFPLIGCRQVLDDIPIPKPPRVPTGAVTNLASAKITGFIKQAGKSAGKSYINQQVVNRLPVSQQSLADVILATAIEELRKTGEVIVDRQIREMKREAIQAAIVAIAEYRQETGSQVEVVE
jgi:hypothetical protein